MNAELKPMTETDEQTAPATLTIEEPTALEVTTETPGTLLKLQGSNPESSGQELRDQIDKVLHFLVVFPDYFTGVFGEYRKPLTYTGLLVVAGLAIAVADGILDRLNTIPLFAPIFELVGLGFTSWFVVRYLLYADARQELAQEYDQIKGRIIGGGN